MDIEVAWSDGESLVATGNSFAAPHIAGLLTRIAGITPAEAKTPAACAGRQPMIGARARYGSFRPPGPSCRT